MYGQITDTPATFSFSTQVFWIIFFPRLKRFFSLFSLVGGPRRAPVTCLRSSGMQVKTRKAVSLLQFHNQKMEPGSLKSVTPTARSFLM